MRNPRLSRRPITTLDSLVARVVRSRRNGDRSFVRWARTKPRRNMVVSTNYDTFELEAGVSAVELTDATSRVEVAREVLRYEVVGWWATVDKDEAEEVEGSFEFRSMVRDGMVRQLEVRCWFFTGKSFHLGGDDEPVVAPGTIDNVAEITEAALDECRDLAWDEHELINEIINKEFMTGKPGWADWIVF